MKKMLSFALTTYFIFIFFINLTAAPSKENKIILPIKEWKTISFSRLVKDHKLKQQLLELDSSSASKKAIIISPEFPVEERKSYELKFRVSGKGAGDTIGSHRFQISGTQLQTQWFDCINFFQRKTFSFTAKPKMKKLRLKITLRNPGRIWIGDFVLNEVKEEISKAEILLDPPFNYRDGVFEKQKIQYITGRVVVNLPNIKGMKIVISANSPCGRIDCRNCSSSKKIPVNPNVKCFRVVAPQPGKTINLKASLQTTSGNILWHDEKLLHNYPSTSNQVWFTNQGFTVVNGKRFFPIGHWLTFGRLNAKADIAFMREAGFNLLLNANKSLLDIAQQNNMKVVRWLWKFRGDTPEKKAEFIKKWEKTRAAEAAHPAFLCYFSADEPAWRGMDLMPLKEVYEYIRKHDPNHPVWINEAPRNSLNIIKKYARFTDIYGADIYPVPEGCGHSTLADQRITCVGKYTKRSLEVVDQRKPIWMILQAFPWKQAFDSKAPQETCIYPSWEQLRFMAYDAIVHGATGIIYHYLGYSKDVNEEFWISLRKVTLELAYLEDILASDTVKDSRLKSDSPGILLMEKSAPSGNYYIIINESNGLVPAKISGFPEKKFNILFESPVEVKNNILKITMPPYGVKILSEQPFADINTIYKPQSYIPYNPKTQK